MNSLMRLCKGAERPCREWWAVLGTVAEALEGLASWGFGIDAGPVNVEVGVFDGFLFCALK